MVAISFLNEDVGLHRNNYLNGALFRYPELFELEIVGASVKRCPESSLSYFRSNNKKPNGIILSEILWNYAPVFHLQ